MESIPITTDWFSSLALAPTDLPFCTSNVPPSFPAEIFHQIVSYLPLPESDPRRLAKAVLLSFSLTCCFFRDFFRNDVYSAISIRSPGSLAGIVEYLGAHTWSGQPTAIKSLTLRWPQGALLRSNQSPTTTGSSARRNISEQITLNLTILLRDHTSSMEELTLDFPNSGVHFQNAIIDGRGIPAHQHLKLKRLHISSGLFPSSPPVGFLLCAISSLCARSLEDLYIHGGCSDLKAPRINSREFYSNRIHVPGVLMFRRFEELQKLQRLHVRNLEGFDEGCLSWMLSGEGMQSPCGRKRNRVLSLGFNPDLTEVGISNALGSVGGGLEELDITVWREEEPLSGENDPAESWCAEATAESDATLSDDSTSDTTYEEDGHTPNSSFISASGHCSCDNDSRLSSRTCHQHHQEGQYPFSVRSISNPHLCAAARACRHLGQLDARMQVICHSSFFNSFPGRDHKNKICPPPLNLPPSSPLEGVAGDGNLSMKSTSSPPPFELSPAIDPQPTPDSPRLVHTNPDTNPSVPSDAPDSRPGSSDRINRGMAISLRGGGGEAKRLSRFAGETRSRVVRGFAKLRGLWKLKQSGGKKERGEQVSSEAAGV